MKTMALPNKLVLILMLTWATAVAVAVAASSSQVIRPACESVCGNVSIPYPFGTSEYCSLNPDFRLVCNRSFTPPKLYFYDSGINVIDISLEGELRRPMRVSTDCYNKSGEFAGGNDSSLSGLNFPISSTRNKFTAVGCDARAEMYGSNITTGCLLGCKSIESITNGSCLGIGCCQTSIPQNLYDFNLTVSSPGSHTEVWDFNPCSYAFIVEEESFNFTSADLMDLRNRTEFPIVIDWAVGNQTCEDAKKNPTSFACQAHSDCYNSDTGSGYRCNCSAGFRGNPYLPHGCKDIDECEDPWLHDCEKKGYCHNTEGGYTCSCPKGYHGDGRKKGEGCIPHRADQSFVVKVVAGVSISGSLLLLLGGFWSCKVIRKMRKIQRKKKFFKRNGGLLLQQQMPSDEHTIEKTKIFTSKELEKATNNFNENRILGQGGQGTVYKGMLTDGRIVAIKKSKPVDESQLKQFINEVVILSQINHRNIVNLLGCCLETSVPLLVYEFVSNGNLFELIHDQNKEFPLSWEMRLQIATEVAGAIAYLHSASSLPIYHRDIKSTNILLDDKYRAKVSDFGTSRSISIDQTHLTTLVHGTFGYLDPEYFQSSQFTEKSDVYSFGVVLAELLTGQKPISSIRSQEDKSLAIHFILSMEENHLFDILDDRVMKEGRKEDIMVVANLAKQCLNLNGKKRPTMKEVAMELEGIRRSLMPLNSQQNFEEGECIVELTGPMDGVPVQQVHI